MLTKFIFIKSPFSKFNFKKFESQVSRTVQTHLKNIHLNSKTQNETLTFASLSNYHHFRQPWNIQTNRDSDGHGTCGPLYVGKQAV